MDGGETSMDKINLWRRACSDNQNGIGKGAVARQRRRENMAGMKMFSAVCMIALIAMSSVKAQEDCLSIAEVRREI